MAPATGGKSGFGWLVLAAALAVPGFLFYNWWSHLKAERDRSVATKARGRLPEGAVFQTQTDSPKFINPISPSTAASAAPAPQTPPQPASDPPRVSAPPVAPAAPVPAPPPPAPAPVPAPVAVAAAAVSSPAEKPAPPPPAAPSTATVVLSRDPMLSPMDIVRMREAELARERSRQEIEDANRARQMWRRPAAKRAEPPVESHIELQGIVTPPSGAGLAIVNGSTLSVGESFRVEGYSAPVRIVKISPLGVTFEYKKRRFIKGVNQE